MALKQHHTDVKIIIALTLVHYIGDFYNSFITPLLPLFIEKFSLNWFHWFDLSNWFVKAAEDRVGPLGARSKYNCF